MAYQNSNPEDVRKLHAEVNQIINQRFLLTTTAITVFGVICTWLIPKNLQPDKIFPGDTSFQQFIFFSSILLTVFLTILFWYSDKLRKMLRVITTYLKIMEESKWENNWALFRKQQKYNHFAYSASQTIIFIVLGASATLFPWILCIIYKLHPSCLIISANVIVGVSYCIYVSYLGFYKINKYESNVEAIWNKIKSKQ